MCLFFFNAAQARTVNETKGSDGGDSQDMTLPDFSVQSCSHLWNLINR